MRRIVALLFALAVLLAAAPVRAIEALEVGTSADRIEITSDFNGGEFVVFGALENADEAAARAGAYDIIVVLEGPQQPVTVRRKERVLGFWINSRSEKLELAPSSYLLASTRDLPVATTEATRRLLALGTQDLRLSHLAASTPPAPNRDPFAEAFLAIKERAGLYDQTAGAVAFVAPTLFRAKLALPRDLPVGRHLVRVLLFRDGNYLVESIEGALGGDERIGGIDPGICPQRQCTLWRVRRAAGHFRGVVRAGGVPARLALAMASDVRFSGCDGGLRRKAGTEFSTDGFQGPLGPSREGARRTSPVQGRALVLPAPRWRRQPNTFRCRR